MTPERRARWLLALGAATGLATAIASLVGGTIDRPLGPDAVAIVNDTPIRRDEVQLDSSVRPGMRPELG